MLKQVLHAGVEVADLAKAIELYKSIGFEVVKQFEKTKTKIAIVTKGESTFELLQFVDNDSPQVAFIRNHVAFASDDLENDVQKFVDDGYKLVIPITEGVTVRYAYLQDAAGACYEIATEKEE